MMRGIRASIGWVVLLAFSFCVHALGAAEKPETSKQDLLNTAKGQLPTDTGTEATKVSVAERRELGGKCVKVELNDSVGDRAARVTNWRSYSKLCLDLVNPGRDEIELSFNVRHKQSVNYATRVDIPFVLKPGKNEIRWSVSEIKNTNGTDADLAHVVRWYVALQSPATTVYLGNVWLEGGEAESTGSNVAVRGDPARLARIRAAKMPQFDKPVMFDTPEADAILSALEVFPADNPWNLVIEDWPVHPNSKNIINSIGAGKPLRYNPDMAFVIVPPDQKRIDLKVVDYPDESDPGPFPIPDQMPIEGWPALFQREANLKHLTLDDVQRDKLNQGGDRHAIVVDPVNGKLYEFYQARKSNAGWHAAQSSIFDLRSNALRPDGWTSSDAAGLPLFPSIVRYDELKRGAVEHALRLTVVKSRRAYVYPATHFASRHTDVNLPRMGERIRLRRDFEIQGFSPEVTAILQGLKKYGMLVADNGIDWAISVAPDPRIPVIHEELRRVKGSDFEVVEPPRGYKPPEK
jgi:hypothetical protein